MTKVTPSVATEFLSIEADVKEKTVQEIVKPECKSERIISSENLEENLPHWLTSSNGGGKREYPLGSQSSEVLFGSQSSELTSELQSPSKKGNLSLQFLNVTTVTCLFD